MGSDTIDRHTDTKLTTGPKGENNKTASKRSIDNGQTPPSSVDGHPAVKKVKNLNLPPAAAYTPSPLADKTQTPSTCP
jgi:hypothetical protein